MVNPATSDNSLLRNKLMTSVFETFNYLQNCNFKFHKILYTTSCVAKIWKKFSKEKIILHSGRCSSNIKGCNPFCTPVASYKRVKVLTSETQSFVITIYRSTILHRTV